MADFWKIVEVNTGICVPKYLKNILMLNGYDDASSVKSITKEDIDSIEEFVKSGIDEYIGDGEAKDFYHTFHNRKDQFIIMKGDRVKLMDVVEFVRNKWASEGGYKFFQQALEQTSSESLHSQEPPDILFIHVDNNQPIKTESNLNDRQLLVSSTTGVVENSQDNAIIAESLSTKQNRITIFSSEVRSDDVKDENLLVPLRLRTPSPPPTKIVWRNENVKIEVEENDTKDDVDFTKDCETTTSHLSKENQIVLLPLNLNHCQVKIAKLNFDNYLPQIGNSSRVNKTTLAHKVKKGLQITPTADVDRESNIGDRMIKEENSTIKRFCCDICGKSFTSKYKIKQHMKFHKGVKLHDCKVCGHAFTLCTDLQRHLRIHTGEKPYVCDVCSKTFSQSSNLSKHKRIHTGEKYVCEVCLKTFGNFESVSAHKKIIHTGEKSFVCDVCEKVFGKSSELSVHKRIHTGEKPFVCDVCPKAFTCSSNLSVHKRIHTSEKPFVCDVCDKKFNQSSSLSGHKRTHTGEKPFVCDVCPKSFSHSASLSAHKRFHSGEALACDFCPKKFTHTSNLAAHKRIHTDEKPFVCDVCRKAFRCSSNLSTHKRIHTSEKPFVCDVCPKSFSHSASLSAHKRFHTGESFACDVCPKTFSHTSNLAAHKRIHTGEKLFVCDVCRKAFIYLSALQYHKKTKCGV